MTVRWRQGPRAGEGHTPCNAILNLRGALPRETEPPVCFVFSKRHGLVCATAVGATAEQAKVAGCITWIIFLERPVRCSVWAVGGESRVCARARERENTKSGCGVNRVLYLAQKLFVLTHRHLSIKCVLPSVVPSVLVTTEVGKGRARRAAVKN